MFGNDRISETIFLAEIKFTFSEFSVDVTNSFCVGPSYFLHIRLLSSITVSLASVVSDGKCIWQARKSTESLS